MTPVVDFALASSKKDRENTSAIRDIDPNRIALMGISLGGYLAARAAAFEDRLSACVLNDGVFDLHEAFVGKYRKTPLEPVMTGTNADLINVAIAVTMGLNVTARWGFTHGMWVFGVNTPLEFVQKSVDFTTEVVSYRFFQYCTNITGNGCRYLIQACGEEAKGLQKDTKSQTCGLN